MSRSYYVYIMSSQSGTLYIGVTNDLKRRIYEHKNGIFEGFSKKYHTNKLVYFEGHLDINQAIAREKQLKGWIRMKKEVLIRKGNRLWNDLSLSF